MEHQSKPTIESKIESRLARLRGEVRPSESVLSRILEALPTTTPSVSPVRPLVSPWRFWYQSRIMVTAAGFVLLVAAGLFGWRGGSSVGYEVLAMEAEGDEVAALLERGDMAFESEAPLIDLDLATDLEFDDLVN